jgi:hypothetical protein
MIEARSAIELVGADRSNIVRNNRVAQEPGMKRPFASLTSVLLLLFAPVACARAQLVVHEWGTMTTQHAANGVPQGRLNLIESADALPPFVHQFEPQQRTSALFAPFAKRERTPGRPDVTMRLETPVIYFYDPSNATRGEGFDVRVLMRGGVLNEFFPLARAGIQHKGIDLTRHVIHGIALDSNWSTTLAWTGVTLDADAAPPQTSAPVWLAPRQVRASKLRVGDEGEHYLFYRGVANLHALLRTRHSLSRVIVRSTADLSWTRGKPATIAQLWLVDVRADGTLAFATRKSLALSGPEVDSLAELDRFVSEDFAAGHHATLWQSMKTALVSEGLYVDEAEAMLRTWQASYFGKPGLRVFYTVPRAWTDFYLPLELSVPHEATRVLIGRIDLMTNEETT